MNGFKKNKNGTFKRASNKEFKNDTLVERTSVEDRFDSDNQTWKDKKKNKP